MRNKNIFSEKKSLGIHTLFLFLLCAFLFFYSFVRLLSQMFAIQEEVGYLSFKQLGEKTFVLLDSGLVLILVTLFIIAGVKLWKLKPRALRDAQWALLFFLGYHFLFHPLLSPLILKFNADMTIFYFKEILKQISSNEITGLIGAGLNITAGIAYIYLCESKRVKAIYGD